QPRTRPRHHLARASRSENENERRRPHAGDLRYAAVHSLAAAYRRAGMDLDRVHESAPVDLGLRLRHAVRDDRRAGDAGFTAHIPRAEENSVDSRKHSPGDLSRLDIAHDHTGDVSV